MEPEKGKKRKKQKQEETKTYRQDKTRLQGYFPNSPTYGQGRPNMKKRSRSKKMARLVREEVQRQKEQNFEDGQRAEVRYCLRNANPEVRKRKAVPQVSKTEAFFGSEKDCPERFGGCPRCLSVLRSARSDELVNSSNQPNCPTKSD